MKKSNFLLILIFALILRLLFINKPQGLWNDEYVSWMISQKPLFNGFWQGVWGQCHMPFYYLYLKFFTSVFGNNDIILRLSSIIPGILAIPVMYLVGKIAHSQKVGKYCAVFCSISSFLIFYSQEVRLYSLLFLLSALSLLFTLKITKKPNRKNLLGYIITNFLIIATHTIGFVYVFFNLVYVSFKLAKSHLKTIITIWTGIIISGISMLPLIIKIFTEKTFSQWWGYFTPSKIVFLFSDYFSPWLINLTNAPDIYLFNPTPNFFIFSTIPTIIAGTLILKALFKKENIEIFSVALLTLTVLIAAAISGKLVLLTKYSIEIYPVLILLACLGLSYINNNLLRKIIAILYLGITLVFMAVNPRAPQRFPRPEGHKIVADMLINCKLNEGDSILIIYYAYDRFEKYFDFSPFINSSINKGNFPAYMTPESNYSLAYENGHELYKSVLASSKNDYFSEKFNTEILSNIKPGQNLVIITFDGVSMLSDQNIQHITSNEKIFSKTPIMYLIFSHIKNKAIEQSLKTLDLTGYQSGGSWSVIKFTKLHK